MQLIGGKAKAAEIYPDDLRGLLRERHNMRILGSLEFGACNDEPDIPTDYEVSEGWDEFIDEVSGKPLETSKVEAARAEELDFAERYNLWTAAPIQEAWDVTGKGPISSRWIDLDKGDLNKPNYRSRLVIQEVRRSGIDAIFAATPPLEFAIFVILATESGHKTEVQDNVCGDQEGPLDGRDPSSSLCSVAPRSFNLKDTAAVSTRPCMVAVMRHLAGKQKSLTV